MNIYRDETTGYLVIDDISEGIDILPSELYQSYLSRIKKLEAEITQLKDKLINIAEKQAEEAVLQQRNEKKFLEIIQETAKSERSIGLAIGLFVRAKDNHYDLAKFYFEVYRILYDEAEKAGVLPRIEAEAEKRCLVDSSLNK